MAEALLHDLWVHAGGQQKRRRGSITVVNDGRRPIKVEKLGIMSSADKPYHSMFADFKPVLLNEGENTSQSIDQAKYDVPSIVAAYAVDGAGRVHYGGFRRGAAGVMDRLWSRFGLPPFWR